MIAKAATPAQYAVGDAVPSRVVEPADAAELASLLRACDEAGDAVVVHGGGTLRGIGRAPRRYDVALLTRRLDAIHDYDPRDLTIGAGAGMTLAAFARTLAHDGQFVPLDAPHPERATLGGTLAAGWAGPRRALYGRPRDVLIGATAALTDGTLATSGGMVVKNVSGYDLAKLYVGSLGTLGVLTRVNFKALPRPAAHRLALAPIAEENRERTLAHVGALPLDPSALLLLHGPFDGLTTGDEHETLLVLYEGTAALVERATRELRSALGSAGVADTILFDGAQAERTFARALDAYVDAAGEPSLTLRAPGLPSTAAARARAALDAGGDDAAIATIADLRTGDVIVRASVTGSAVAAAVVERVRAAAGPAAVLAASGAVEVDPWGAAPPAIETMRALKRRFDPKATLAPGRFVGGI